MFVYTHTFTATVGCWYNLEEKEREHENHSMRRAWSTPSCHRVHGAPKKQRVPILLVVQDPLAESLPRKENLRACSHVFPLYGMSAPLHALPLRDRKQCAFHATAHLNHRLLRRPTPSAAARLRRRQYSSGTSDGK